MTVKIQRSNCIDQGEFFFFKKEILKDESLIAKHHNFRGQIEE
jgi:hypothetical protein